MKTPNDSLTAIPAALAESLAKAAPSICFLVSRDIDESYKWDGDGPDPRDEGFDPYDVDVTARIIVRGQIVQGSASLGGCYFRSDEPTGEIHGYLVQMLGEALENLSRTLSRNFFAGRAFEEVEAAHAFVREELHRRYAEQMAAR